MKKMLRINVLITIVLLTWLAIFTIFFAVDKDAINEDINEKYELAETLIERSINDTIIVLFSVGKEKTGIANYIKLPFINKYFCERSYTLEILDEPIRDVFVGKWNGYAVSATPERIILDDVTEMSERAGFYWRWIDCIMLIICVESLTYLYKKARGKRFKFFK